MEMRSQRRALDKLYKRRDRYDIPDWQREKVWSVEKKRRLIDTILRGWKLPKFYFQKTHENPDEFDVVDGQQRLTAIWEFYEGELTLSEEQAKEFGGSDLEHLPEALSDAFDDYEIEYDEISEGTDEEVKEFFQRLQEGLPLTASEKLNSIHSKLRDYCAKASKHSFFPKTTVISNKRYAYFDIVAKVATLELEGLDAGLRYDDVKKVFKAYAMFSPQSAAAKRINRILKYLKDNFPESFKPFRNRTIVQSVITLACHLDQAGLAPRQHRALAVFIRSFLTELSRQVELGQNATDSDFTVFQRTVNANVKSGALTRQSILLRKLFRQHPDFFCALSHSAELSEGLVKDVAMVGKDVRDLVASCNERYAAIYGHDLFKPTNKTASALAGLGVPAESLDEYKTFVDQLYFVFREGIGQRMADELPESFTDVKSLRTMLDHDVDHGKPSEAGRKRKDLAKVFAKYSGVSSPDALDPAQFPLVQANILGALKRDLVGLAKSLSEST
jgi:Protein of unknown function DUF262